MHPLLNPYSLLPALLLTCQTTANPLALDPSSNNLILNPPLPYSFNMPSSTTILTANLTTATHAPSATLTQSPNNSLSLSNNSTDYGINCMGSRVGCIGASSGNIMHVLRDYMSLLHKYPQIRYVAGQKIACKEHTVFPLFVEGYYCAFMQGANVPSAGVGGDLLLVKMQQLIEHGCQGCGSVPLEDGNDPRTMGMLVVNYVAKSECVGLCFYGKGGFEQEIRFDGDTDNGTVGEQSRRILNGNGGRPIISANYLPAHTVSPGHAPRSLAEGAGGVVGGPAGTTSVSISTPTTTMMTTRGGREIISAHYIAPHTVLPTRPDEDDPVAIVEGAVRP